MNQVTIEKLIYGGMGLARTESGVLFVSDVLPGEVVNCLIDDKVQGVPTARPVDILQLSPDRRQPECPYFGECGGCDWLHINYDTQIQIKEQIFIECLNRIGKIKSLPLIEIFRSPEKGYRIRAQLKIDAQGKCGFFRKKSNEIVHLTECPLLAEPCNEIIRQVNSNRFSINTDTLKLIAGNDKVASDPVIDALTVNAVDMVVGEFTFKLFGDSFFQSNRFLIESMGRWASPYVKGGYCVDLYGGTGLFSVMLGKQFSKGLLIEAVRSLVKLADENLINNNCSHFRAVCADAEQFDRFIEQKPDLLIIDPPRVGLTKKALNSIIAIEPSEILYVSCDPSTQARDVGVLVNNAGYTITHAALFDCYPNTYHIETALLLKKAV
jgi:23S rRNA (uracil1939-C5)-methyltransferase